MIKDKENNIQEKEEIFPDHTPVIPYNFQLEKDKELARKKAEELRKKSGKNEIHIVTQNGEIKKVTQLTVGEKEYEFIKCATDPIYFIKTYLTVFDQTKGAQGEIVPFNLFDFQEELVNTYVNERYVIANKYRQAGISTTTCAFIAWHIMFNQNRQVAIVADKLETARDEIMSDVVQFIDGCPEFLRPKTGKESNEKFKDTQKLKIYDNGSRLGAFSSKGLRGMTPTLIFWDEVAWTEKSDKFWTAAKPALGTGGRAIMVSCVTKDTYIYTDKGIKQIKDFMSIDEELGYHIIDNYNILGKDKLRKGELFYNNGLVQTLKIKTPHAELESSFNHKYWAYKVKDSKYDWYQASELECGDYVSVQYNMNIWCNNDNFPDFKSSRIKNIFKNITPEIAYVIGSHIGSINRCNVLLNKNDKHYDLMYIENDPLLFKNTKKTSLKSSTPIIEFLKYLNFDTNKKNLRIPTRLLEMSKENIISLIAGIIRTSKLVNRSENIIRFSSKELYNQINILLGNLGYMCMDYEYYHTDDSNDIIPNGIDIFNKINNNGSTIESSNLRCEMLNLIDLKRKDLSDDLLNEFKNIISPNIYWSKIVSINKSKNLTYDFSLPDDIKEDHDFHHSVIYNSIITHNTPSGLDPVFYKTFQGARKKENNFVAVELWWFNDPRYNKDLVWLKNKGKENEIKLVDENWTKEKRIQLMDDGWEASSPWFEEQIRDANGDMRKIAQELMCSFLGSGDNFIAEEFLKRIEENEIKPPIRQEFIDLNMWIWEDPIPGESYIIGVDVSPGHGEDSSTVNILKVKEIIEEKIINKNNKIKKVKIKRNIAEQVAEYYGKVTPQMLAEIVYQFGKRYNDAYCVVDITGGYGAQTVEKLFEIGYDSVHYSEIMHKPLRDRLQGYIKKGEKTMPDGAIVNVDLVPGFFIGNNRASVLLELQRAVNFNDIIIKSVRLLNELKTFITVAGNRVADHKRSFHDDSIMGTAIALYCLNFDMVKFKQNTEMTEKMINCFLTLNDVNNYKKDKKEEIPKYKSTTNPDLNPYIAYSWLFEDLKKKNDD